MPRPKGPTLSLKSRRKRNREKSARHYARNRDRILASKRAARCQSSLETGNLSSSGAHKPLRVEGSPTELDFEARFASITNALKKCTNGSPCAYLDRVCQQHIAISRQTGPTDNRSILTTAEGAISAILESCYGLQNDILQETGVNSNYERAESLSRRVKCILEAIVNLEYVDMDPDDDVQEAFLAGRLNFQKVTVKGWINGTHPIPN
ncbi:hypothetical protein VNI00_003485 [Paramarasmius palmivorus]|uniref:Uncharacterized protein n=1 Tax=Paramarasmius palmivorus TaxID=297713 RepID=A0AAW0DNU7_9AGAR